MQTITSNVLNTNVQTGRGRRPTNKTFTFDEIANAVHVDVHFENVENKHVYYIGGHMVDDGFGELIYVPGTQRIGSSVHCDFVEHNVKRGCLARFKNKTVAIHYDDNRVVYVKKI